jgi:hypothetical protein
MVSTIAHLINVVVTNPFGTGWFDRYGLQTADNALANLEQRIW